MFENIKGQINKCLNISPLCHLEASADLWVFSAIDSGVCSERPIVFMVAASQASTITSRQAINYRVEENLLAIYSVNLTNNGLAQCPLIQNIMTASFL